MSYVLRPVNNKGEKSVLKDSVAESLAIKVRNKPPKAVRCKVQATFNGQTITIYDGYME